MPRFTNQIDLAYLIFAIKTRNVGEVFEFSVRYRRLISLAKKVKSGTFPRLCSGHLMISRSKQTVKENSGILKLVRQVFESKSNQSAIRLTLEHKRARHSSEAARRDSLGASSDPFPPDRFAVRHSHVRLKVELARVEPARRLKSNGQKYKWLNCNQLVLVLPDATRKFSLLVYMHFLYNKVGEFVSAAK